MTRSFALLGCMALAGCGVPPRPAPPQPLQATDLGLVGQPASPIAPDWWTEMGDAQLDRIMAAALAGNPSLDAAIARLNAARASLGESEAATDPQASISAEATRQRLSGRSVIPPPFAGSTRWIASAQANLSWNLDLFGRQRALIAQAGDSVRAVGLDAAAARVAIAGNVAAAYVDLARAYALADVARDLVQSRVQSQRLAATRIRTGLASQFEARASEVTLGEARQALVRAEAAQALAVHALAALAGQGVDFYAGIIRPTLSPDRMSPLPAMLPADLLGRRADLLAAQARIDAAIGGRAAARADFYPNVDLRALIGLASVGLGSFLTGDARTYGGGPALSLPLFDGGRLRARYAGASANLDLAVAEYDQSVLGAVREAADALTRADAAQRDLVEQRRILGGLDATIRLDRRRVSTGLGSQLDLLETGTRVLAARQAEAGLAADAARARIQVLVALGGGFVPPDRPDVTR